MTTASDPVPAGRPDQANGMEASTPLTFCSHRYWVRSRPPLTAALDRVNAADIGTGDPALGPPVPHAPVATRTRRRRFRRGAIYLNRKSVDGIVGVGIGVEYRYAPVGRASVPSSFVRSALSTVISADVSDWPTEAKALA
jgi:hypothetical protein